MKTYRLAVTHIEWLGMIIVRKDCTFALKLRSLELEGLKRGPERLVLLGCTSVKLEEKIMGEEKLEEK